MTRPGRVVVSPPRRQANAREAAMNALRAMPNYGEFVLSLRQAWKAVQDRQVGGEWVSLLILNHVQRDPYDADLYTNLGLRSSTELRTYLAKLDDIVARHFQLTADDAPAWWVRQDLHNDALRAEPIPWWDRADPWRFEAPAEPPEWRIAPTAFSVHVTQHAPNAEAPVSAEIFPDLESAITAVEASITQHYRAQGWQRNAAAEARMLEQDIPALVAWYVAGRQPDADKDRRRLRDIARNELVLDLPPPAPNRRRKTPGRFFARPPENSD
jgi:hypothetical protein